MRKVYASCPCCHQCYWTGEFTKGRGPSGVTVALVGVLDAALLAITSAESLDQAPAGVTGGRSLTTSRRQAS